jgi:hypothetical protein
MEKSKEEALQRSREIEIFMSRVFLTSLENRWCKENPTHEDLYFP